MRFLQAINSDISVLRVCNKTGGTIKGDIKKNFRETTGEEFFSLLALQLSVLRSFDWSQLLRWSRWAMRLMFFFYVSYLWRINIEV